MSITSVFRNHAPAQSAAASRDNASVTVFTSRTQPPYQVCDATGQRLTTSGYPERHQPVSRL